MKKEGFFEHLIHITWGDKIHLTSENKNWAIFVKGLIYFVIILTILSIMGYVFTNTLSFYEILIAIFIGGIIGGIFLFIAVYLFGLIIALSHHHLKKKKILLD